MDWSETIVAVLTNEQFWLGVVAVAGVFTTLVGTWRSNRNQRFLQDREREDERRRARRQELVDAYDAAGTHATLTKQYLRHLSHGDVPRITKDEERDLYRSGHSRKQSLLLHGASQDVIDAWNRFEETVKAFDEDARPPQPTRELDRAILELYQAFNRHVETVWRSPEDPRRLVRPPDGETTED